MVKGQPETTEAQYGDPTWDKLFNPVFPRNTDNGELKQGHRQHLPKWFNEICPEMHVIRCTQIEKRGYNVSRGHEIAPNTVASVPTLYV